MSRRVLVAGMGNVLRGDDGFGPAVVQELEANGGLPEGARLVEVGIGGVGLVHELMAGYDALVLIDAVEREGEPGTVYVLQPEVPPAETVRDVMGADMHVTVPGPALILARAAGVLPPVVRIVGCQPAETEEFCLELSPAVRRTVTEAAATVRALVRSQLDGA